MKRIIRRKVNKEGWRIKDYYTYIEDIVIIYRYLLVPKESSHHAERTEHKLVKPLKTHSLWFKSFSVRKETLLEIIKGFEV